MSLQQWFYIHAKRPLFIAVVLVLTIMLSSAWIFHQMAMARHQQMISNAQASVSIALTQKNRMLFENILESFAFQTGSEDLTACMSNQVVFQYSKQNSARGTCENDMGADVLHVSGFNELQIFYQQPSIFKDEKVMVYLGLTFIALIFVVGLFAVLIRKFQNEVLMPLADKLESQTPHPISELQALQSSLQNSKNTQIKLSVAEAIVNRNQQIGHDIRSPLTALLTVMENSSGLHEDSRELLEIATSRIRDIAADLLRSKEKSNLRCIQTLLQRLVKEKQAQLHISKQIEFNIQMTPENLEFKESIDVQKIIRILSNLINNSCESIAASGTVTVRVTESEDAQITFEVIDTGCGLSAETVESQKMFQESLGEGKQSSIDLASHGHGLGLSSAKTYIEILGGIFHFSSQKNKGTIVRFQLP